MRWSFADVVELMSVVVMIAQIFFDKIPLPDKLPADIHVESDYTLTPFQIASTGNQRYSSKPLADTNLSYGMMILFSN
jgi:hypothetical protein